MISIKKYADMQNDPIFKRESYSYGVEDTVKAIIEDVKKNGDPALFAYTKKFDRAELSSLEVSSEEIEVAWNAVDPELIAVMQEAYDAYAASMAK